MFSFLAGLPTHFLKNNISACICPSLSHILSNKYILKEYSRTWPPLVMIEPMFETWMVQNMSCLLPCQHCSASHAISKWKTFLSGSGALSYNSSVALEKHKQQLLQKQEHTLFIYLFFSDQNQNGSMVQILFKSSFQLVSETPNTD